VERVSIIVTEIAVIAAPLVTLQVQTELERRREVKTAACTYSVYDFSATQKPAKNATPTCRYPSRHHGDS